VQPIQIIRKPINGEAAGTTLSTSRLYNKAQIRVLLADSLADLHPERGAAAIDVEDVNLTNQQTATFPIGGGFNVGGTIYPFAQADQTKDGNWIKNVHDGASAQWSLFKDTAVTGTRQTWLRVEYKNAAGNWIGVTNEWLGLGFARDFDSRPGRNHSSSNATSGIFASDGPIFTRSTNGGRRLRNTRSPGIDTLSPKGYVTRSTWWPSAVRARIR
jgi:hypothetical protein